VPSSLLDTAVITSKSGWLNTNLAKDPKARLYLSSSPNSRIKPLFLYLNTFYIVLLSSGISSDLTITNRAMRRSKLSG
jgi:hypothetical protein